MYRAYVDGRTLFDPHLGYNVVDPKVTLELNKVGSFDFTIYPEHPYYGLLTRMKSVIEVWDEQQLVFRGRILDDEEGFHNQRAVECESDAAYLIDSIVRPYDYSGTLSGLFTKYVQDHNAQVEEGKRFKVGNVTVTDKNDYVHYSSTVYPTTWDEMMDKLVDTHGGYIFVRHEDDGAYLDYLSDFTLLSNQPVTFGRNLLDFARTVKGDELATAIIPLGAKGESTTDDEGNSVEGERLTIASVNDGKDYLYDEDAVDSYGWIFCTQTWDDVTDATNLKTKGAAELAQRVLLGTEIELSAVDLAALDSNYSNFHLGTYVKVVSEPHNLNQSLLVSKLSIDLASPASNTLTLGKTGKSLTEQQYGSGGSLNGHQSAIKEEQESSAASVTGIVPEYYVSTSRTELAGGTWTTETPTVPAGRYLWYRMRFERSDGTHTYGAPAMITGNDGQDGAPGQDGDDGSPGQPGADGDDGRGVASVTPEYYLSTSDETQEGGSWSTTQPEYSPNLFLWTRFRVTYTDGTSATTDPVLETSWQAADDVRLELTQSFTSLIEQTETSIRTEVAEGYYLKSDGETLASEVATQYEQLSHSFNYTFSQFEADLEALAAGTDAQYEEIVKYIRFIDGVIYIGIEGNDLELRISNDRVSFRENNVEVAYISNNKLYITDAEVRTRMDIGKFSFQPRDNGNLTLRYIG